MVKKSQGRTFAIVRFGSLPIASATTAAALWASSRRQWLGLDRDSIGVRVLTSPRSSWSPG